MWGDHEGQAYNENMLISGMLITRVVCTREKTTHSPPEIRGGTKGMDRHGCGITRHIRGPSPTDRGGIAAMIHVHRRKLDTRQARELKRGAVRGREAIHGENGGFRRTRQKDYAASDEYVGAREAARGLDKCRSGENLGSESVSYIHGGSEEDTTFTHTCGYSGIDMGGNGGPIPGADGTPEGSPNMEGKIMRTSSDPGGTNNNHFPTPTAVPTCGRGMG